jgi:serine/alanine adding enzyme
MLIRPPKVHPPRRPVLEGVVEPPRTLSARGLIPDSGREPGISVAETQILIYPSLAFAPRLPALADFIANSAPLVPLSRHPAWLNILQTTLGHESYAIEATAAGRTIGFLPLAFLDTILFGKFLVSLPYLNTNGVVAASPAVQTALVARAVALAEELNVRHLELRHETAIDHPGLNARITSKVHMRLSLPKTTGQLWKGFNPKVRNQIRKGEKHPFIIDWGGAELVEPFYDVISRNMRDLGSPMYGIELFREILSTFPGNAEICVVKDKDLPVAASLLLHGWGVTEVPTASSLKEYNPSSVNMLMYWHLLQRAAERGQQVFDFGRSTMEGNTFRFKKQWGALPDPAVWQYCVNRGDVSEMRPDNPRYRRAIRIWQQLPLAITRFLGPRIIRGIP